MITLTYAIGLLGLIGIPVLIAIYIIKNKYTEQTVTSTYLWNLSEKFIKKRIPISRIVGIISLILQILVVALASLLIAHPVVILPGAANAYCFILDGSGSMNIVEENRTRFDIGKDEIRNMIGSAANGSMFTLIYAGNAAETICYEVTDPQRAYDALDKLVPSDLAPDPIEVLDAAQEYFDENRAAINYFITDKDYETVKNAQIINVTADRGPVENYALGGVEYIVDADGKLAVSGKVKSYASAADIELKLSVMRTGGTEFEGASTADVAVEADGEEAEFKLTADTVDFTAFKVEIVTPDALEKDSEVIVYNLKYENIGTTLVVSDDTAFFLRGALRACGTDRVDTCTTKEYASGSYTGYGLYIFDSYSPDEMPRDGAVWFIDPKSTVRSSNFTYQGPVGSVGTARFSNDTSTQTRKLLEGTSKREFEVDGYVKCGVNSKFSTLVAVDGNPLVFAGSNSYGNREAVFAFKLSASAPFVISADFPTIINNLLNYSFPSVLEETVYTCGDVLPVNVLPLCKSILVTTPRGGTAHLDTSVAVSEYRLTEAGVYNIDVVMGGGDVRRFNVFAALPEEERAPLTSGTEFLISGLKIDGRFNGFYDNLMIIFIALAVIAVADFGVYCYEQYQLR